MAHQIILIDWTNGYDKTVCESICSNCRRQLDYTLVNDDPNVVVYKKCPFCGETFTKHLITEEK